MIEKVVQQVMQDLTEKLNLEYETVFDRDLMLISVLSVFSLIGGIFFLTHGTNKWFTVTGVTLLIFFCRIMIGSVTKQQLTAESRARLEAYMLNITDKPE